MVTGLKIDRLGVWEMINRISLPLGSVAGIAPVFVVGMARSGTTPLQLALNMHPQLGVYGETAAFFMSKKFGRLTHQRNMNRLLRDWRAIISSCCPYPDLLETRYMRDRLAGSCSYAEVLNRS